METKKAAAKSESRKRESRSETPDTATNSTTNADMTNATRTHTAAPVSKPPPVKQTLSSPEPTLALGRTRRKSAQATQCPVCLKKFVRAVSFVLYFVSSVKLLHKIIYIQYV